MPSPATSSARCWPTTSLRQGAHTSDDVLATTVVSSRLLSKLAAAAGVAYGEALTGFKWVVRTPLPGQRFLFGYEEALGYCVGTLVRDKDGVTAALVAAELAARLKAEGSHAPRSAARGVPHPRRPRHPAAVDPTHGQRLAGPRHGRHGIRARDAARRGGRASGHRGGGPRDRHPPPAERRPHLDARRRPAVVRPSGTEPKLKIYAEAVVPVDDDVEAARSAAAAIVDEVLAAATDLLTTHGL